MILTIESIKNLLKTNDTALIRALIAINDNHQKRSSDDNSTAFQRSTPNKIGWKDGHVTIGPGMVSYYNAHQRLTPKQLEFWRGKGPDNNTRIDYYAEQLLKIAQEKADSKPDIDSENVTEIVDSNSNDDGWN